ncbi:unnamed protein product [Parajaminaea phylloscopi]
MAAAGKGGWASALTRYARTSDPAVLSADVLLRHDDRTLTIYDGFDKAKYHFLVLPRLPFRHSGGGEARLAEPQSLQAAAGKLAFGSSSSQKLVPDSHLHSLESLLRSPYAAEVIEALESAAIETRKEIRERMAAAVGGETSIRSPRTGTLSAGPKDTPSSSPAKDKSSPPDYTWDVQMGFHAVPSMDTVHLHVISTDLVSPRLKHKKHYQSFHPTKGFFLHLDQIKSLVAANAKALPRPPSWYEDLLKQPLVSHIDGKTYKNMPELKRHLERAWIEGTQTATTSREPSTVARTRVTPAPSRGAVVPSKRSRSPNTPQDDSSHTESE